VRFPFSGTLTLLQFGFSAGAVRFLKAVGVLEADTLSFTKVRLFAPAVLMFYAAIAANMRLLSKSTVHAEHSIRQFEWAYRWIHL